MRTFDERSPPLFMTDSFLNVMAHPLKASAITAMSHSTARMRPTSCPSSTSTDLELSLAHSVAGVAGLSAETVLEDHVDR